MTPTEYISYIIMRYEAWLLSGVYPKEQYKNEKEWRDEIHQKIEELKNKIKS